VHSLTPGSTVRGTLALTGTADSDQLGQKSGFGYYKIEIGTGEKPNAWRLLAKSTQPVADGPLGTWDTTGMPNDTYTIRLTVVDVTGNYGPWQEITVHVANGQP
jgi:hypothetical protein